MNVPSFAEKAIDILEAGGFEAYFVGGCVRNSLLDIEISDFDITTSAKPDEVVSLFSDFRVIETGVKHGTVTVFINSQPLEITTFRSESGYSDHRRPDKVLFSENLESDLMRRDFTINALAYNKKTGIIDLFGGKNDIKNKIIRTVGDATERFNEDALRILRALRFASVLGFSIEEKTALAIKEDLKLLSFVSKERIFGELKKLILGQNAEEVLKEYKEVFSYIFNGEIEYKNLKMLKTDFALRLAFILRNADFKAALKSILADNKTKINVFKIIGCLKRKTVQNNIEMKYLLKDFSEDAVLSALEIKKALGENIDTELNLFYNARGECYNLKALNIRGSDLGLEGKEVGKILSYLLDMVIREEIANSYEELLKEARNFLN